MSSIFRSADPITQAVLNVSALHDSQGREGRRYLFTSSDGAFSTLLTFPPAKNSSAVVTNEALITVLIHRIEILNKEMPSEHNDEALVHLRAALTSLNAREASVNS